MWCWCRLWFQLLWFGLLSSFCCKLQYLVGWLYCQWIVLKKQVCRNNYLFRSWFQMHLVDVPSIYMMFWSSEFVWMCPLLFSNNIAIVSVSSVYRGYSNCTSGLCGCASSVVKANLALKAKNVCPNTSVDFFIFL